MSSILQQKLLEFKPIEECKEFFNGLRILIFLITHTFHNFISKFYTERKTRNFY